MKKKHTIMDQREASATLTRAVTNGANGSAVQEMVQRVGLGEIVRSPWNRTIDTKAAEFQTFAANVKERGVEIPLICRALPSALDPERKPGAPRLELVAGERRWLAAAEAKLPDVPVIVRKLTDREALELQAIENEQRQDTSPIEKAEKYQQLLDQYEKAGMNKEAAIAELCKKLSIGKKTEIGKSTVYEALRLLKLPAPVKEAVKGGKLPASHAGLIAKRELDDAPEVQAKLLELIAPANKQNALLDADGTLEDEYDLWDLSRDSNGVLSFRNAMAVVDRECKLSSARKAWETAAAAHRSKGGRVLTQTELEKERKHFLQGRDHTADYSNTYSYETYETLMGKHAPPVVLAHDVNYEVLKLYPRKEALKAIEKNGRKKRPRSLPGSSRMDERKEIAARLAPVVEAAVARLLAAAQKSGAKIPWPVLLGWVASMVDNYGSGKRSVISRHSWKAEAGYDGFGKTIEKNAGKLPEKAMPVLLLELYLEDEERGPFDQYTAKFGDVFQKLCRHYRIDLQKLTNELAPVPEKAKPEKKSQASGKKKFKSGVRDTAAGRKKLSDAMKARWAARRKGKS